MKIKTTSRGFEYIDVEDSSGCIVRIQRSSVWGMEHVWIFCNDPNGVYDKEPRPHLNPEQAIKVAQALLYFATKDEWEEK